MGLLGQQDSDIAHVRPGGARCDCIAERDKERISVAALEKVLRVEADCAGTLNRSAVNDSAGCGTITVDTIRAGAKRDKGHWC